MSRITLLLLISTLFSKFQYEFQSFNLEMETKKISFQFCFVFIILVVIILCCTPPPSVSDRQQFFRLDLQELQRFSPFPAASQGF